MNIPAIIQFGILVFPFQYLYLAFVLSCICGISGLMNTSEKKHSCLFQLLQESFCILWVNIMHTDDGFLCLPNFWLAELKKMNDLNFTKYLLSLYIWNVYVNSFNMITHIYRFNVKLFSSSSSFFFSFLFFFFWNSKKDSYF